MILGATEARDDRGQPVLLRGHRLRALLAALALHADRDAAVPVDVLINEVWADGAALPDDAPAALQALVGRLRRALGKDAVQSLPGGYRLRAATDEVDLFRFRRLAAEGEHALAEGDPATAARLLRAALALWRGPALADLPDRTSAAARAEAVRAAAHQSRVTADLALGHVGQALPELRELAAARPLDEPLQALLVRTLRDHGRTAEALEAYERVRLAISERLGADPGTELRTLHAELLAAVPDEAASDADGDETGPPVQNREVEPPGEPRPAGTPRTGRPEAPPVPQGNLRARLTSFVGRETDLGTIRHELRRFRLVTLTGPGGSGKTRLSEQAAAAAAADPPPDGTSAARYPDGVWMAELAPLDHPAAVPGAVLNALGRRGTSLFTGTLDTTTARTQLHEHEHDATVRLVEHCATRRLLLVLDNCEHVIDAAAQLAETLLAHCPGLTVLATSREPLGVPGEAVRPVEPLPPAPAHRLFTDRAVAARPDFRAEEDPAAVAEICRRLDGLPLAIELAAARLRSLTPRQIADRLDDRFRLLTSGSRTVLPRQQTLRAVVDWSWDLLDEPERTVVRRLSVFSGGCTLPAAEQVCADAPHPGTEAGIAREDVLGILGSLVDKSILIADHPRDTAPEPGGDSGIRYRMLETIHEYAQERAAEHPADREAAERRHTGEIVRMVEEAAPRLRSAGQLTWLRRLEADLDNVRSALHRSLETGGTDAVLALVRGMGWFWWLRNYRDEGGSWAGHSFALLPAEADARDEEQELAYRELQLLRYFLHAEQGDHASLRDEHHLAVARELVTYFSRGEPASARFPGMLWPFAAYFVEGSRGVLRHMDVAVEACRRYGGRWELAVMLLFQSHVRIDSREGIDVLDDVLPEIERLAHSTGDRWLIGQVCGLRAEMAAQYGRYALARHEYEASLRHARQLGALTELPFILVRIAEICFREGDSAEAEKIVRRAIEDAEGLGVNDAGTYGSFLAAVIALDNGDIPAARELHRQAGEFAAIGTPPTMFEVAMLSTEGRITAAEGGSPHDAVRCVRDALRRAVEAGSPDLLVASVLLHAATVTLSAGAPVTAVRLADAAVTRRGDLAAGVPEERQDAEVRAGAGERARTEAARTPDVPDPEQAADLLDTLLTTLSPAG
nr:BTAD domain-containing putative transcriptional regulator [Streptomyces sp. HNM0574]